MRKKIFTKSGQMESYYTYNLFCST